MLSIPCLLTTILYAKPSARMVWKTYKSFSSSLKIFSCIKMSRYLWIKSGTKQWFPCEGNIYISLYVSSQTISYPPCPKRIFPFSFSYHKNMILLVIRLPQGFMAISQTILISSTYNNSLCQRRLVITVITLASSYNRGRQTVPYWKAITIMAYYPRWYPLLLPSFVKNTFRKEKEKEIKKKTGDF